MKTILSLFDYSGAWSAPYADAGHNVVQIDLKHDPDLFDIRKFNVEYIREVLGLDTVDGILAAPPCTDFTTSGNQHWAKKDADGRTMASREMVMQVIRCVEYFKPDFWVIENPVGRLAKLVQGLGKPFVFHPHHFAGLQDNGMTQAQLDHLDALAGYHKAKKAFTAEDIDLIRYSNRYTKRTCLWGRFNSPSTLAADRDPIRVCDAGSWLMKLGGDSAETKEARSHTPEGFAQAFFQANCWTDSQTKNWANERAAEAALYFLEGNLDATPEEVLAVFDPEEHPDADQEGVLDAWGRLFSPLARKRSALAAIAV